MEQNYNPYTNPPEGGMPNQFSKNHKPPFQNTYQKPNYFEIFSFGFAIASLFSCTIIYTAYMFGGLAILFALLSRGAQMKMSKRAKWSTLIGIAGIVLSTVLFVATFLYLLEEYGSLEGILREGSEIMGIDFEEEFGELFQ